MKKLLAAGARRRVTVIYSIAGNFGPADIMKDVAPLGSEPIVKSHADKFIDTDLEKILKDKGIRRSSSRARRRTAPCSTPAATLRFEALR